MENTEKTLISDETKGLFRTSASWMRGYSITMIVLLSIILLCLLILLAQSELVFELMGGRRRVPDQVMSVINGFLIMGIIVVATGGYAFIKLLASGNKFQTVSYSAKKDDVVSAFKNLKLYWMITGICIIILFFVGIYVGIKLIPQMR